MKRHIFFLGLLALLLCSCGTERQVVYQTQYRDRIVEHRDSIFVREDTHTSERQKGDTVYITAETVRYVYKDRLRCDTVYISRTDSLTIDRPVYVEKPIKWYNQAFIWLGRLCGIAFILWAVALCVKRRF